VVRMLNGTLVALVEPGPFNATSSEPVFIRSTDGGKVWSEPYTGVLPQGVGKIHTLGVRRDGRLMAVISKGTDNLTTPEIRRLKPTLPDGREVEAYSGYRIKSVTQLAFSSDQGKTWTMGNLVGSQIVSTWTGGRILELDDGTLVLPVHGYLSDQDMDGIWISNGVRRSSDDGATWTLSVIGRANPNDAMIFSEPSVAKLDDGTLVALMRSEDRVIDGTRGGLFRAISSDGGKTWSSPTKTLGGTHCSLIQLPDGVLLCGYHGGAPRLALSADRGGTWYANMPWLTEEGTMSRGWYTSAELVDKTTAVVLIKEAPAPHIIRACLLRR